LKHYALNFCLPASQHCCGLLYPGDLRRSMEPADPTELLASWRSGSRAALDALFPLVYDDLRSRAHRLLQGQPAGLTLSTTALVHESYLKLIRSDRLTVQDRAHFLALAAHA